MSIENIIRAIEAERDALQVEIDQRIDLHGLLDRTARQLAEGSTGAPAAADWGVSITTTAAPATWTPLYAVVGPAPKVVAPAGTAAPGEGTHCITAHKRAPLREELTPVAASGGAA